jgi:hypothetical protein
VPYIQVRTRGAAQPSRATIAFTLLVCGIVIYGQTFVFPAIPRSATGDQAIYLHHGARMLAGQLIYRDYDHFTLPGTDTVYYFLFRIFGVRAWIPDVMLVLLGTGLAALSILISRKLVTGMTALLPALLFVMFPFSSYLDASHHWYGITAAMAALAVLIAGRTPGRCAIAGALWGLGTFFTQSMVLGVLGVAAFLIWEYRVDREPVKLLLRKQLVMWGSYLSSVGLLSLYFVLKAGLRAFWFYTVVFVARYYSADTSNSWRTYGLGAPSFRSWYNWPNLSAFLLVHLLLPLVYVLFFVRYRRERKVRPQQPWSQLMLVAITGMVLLLGVASAPVSQRLYAVSLPALILLAWVLDSSAKGETFLRRGLWVAVIVVAATRIVSTRTRWHAMLDLPSGRTAFFSTNSYQQTNWLADRTRPGDYFFGDQFSCFALQLTNPTRVPFLRNTEYTRPFEVEDVIAGLERHKTKYVAWYADLNGPSEPAEDHLGPVRQYLKQHYEIAVTFGNGNQVWERTR